MWRRRLFITALISLIPSRFARAQNQLTKFIVTDPPNLEVVANFQWIATQLEAVSLATEGTKAAIEKVRQISAVGTEQLKASPISLSNLDNESLVRLIIAQHNSILLLSGIIAKSKNSDGQIAVSESSVDSFMKEICPLFPFC